MARNTSQAAAAAGLAAAQKSTKSDGGFRTRPSRRQLVRCAAAAGADDAPPQMPARDRSAKTLTLQIGESEVRWLESFPYSTLTATKSL
jgi:hypothetical protein